MTRPQYYDSSNVHLRRETAVRHLVLCNWLAAGFALAPAFAHGGAETIPTVSLYVEEDGSLQLEGTRYANANLTALKAKLDEISKRHPRPNLVVVTQKSAADAAIVRVIKLFQEAGVPKFAIFTEPRNPR